MTLDTSSDGWYDDPKLGQRVWTYGKEIWCNLQGRYTYIVAEFGHLFEYIYPLTTYKMRLCQLGIMGTEYVRNEEILTEMVLEQGIMDTIAIPHITSALTIGNTLQINLRQKSDSELDFVSFSNTLGSTDVIFSGEQTPGTYELVLESFDEASSV